VLALAPPHEDARIDAGRRDGIGSDRNIFHGVLPLRTGEVVRIGYFSRRTGAPLMATTAALVLERVLDVMMLALFAAVFLSGAVGRELKGLPVPPWVLGAGVGCAAFGMIVTGFWLAWRSKKGARPESESRLMRLFNDGLSGLAALESKSAAAQVMTLSLLMWFVTMLPGVFIFRAMNLTVPFTDVVTITLGTAFAVAAPAAPGFVGTFHAGFVLAAKLVGIDKDIAVPAAVVSHLLSQVPFILAGGVVLVTGGRKALAKGPRRRKRNPLSRGRSHEVRAPHPGPDFSAPSDPFADRADRDLHQQAAHHLPSEHPGHGYGARLGERTEDPSRQARP